jgi:hypothetical protein
MAEPMASGAMAGWALIAALCDLVLSRSGGLDRGTQSLIAADEADLSEEGCRLRRRAIHAARDRDRCLRSSPERATEADRR